MSDKPNIQIDQRTKFKVQAFIREAIGNQITIPQDVQNDISMYCRPYEEFVTNQQRFDAEIDENQTRIKTTTIRYGWITPVLGRLKLHTSFNEEFKWTLNIEKMPIGLDMAIGVCCYLEENMSKGGHWMIFSNGDTVHDAYLPGSHFMGFTPFGRYPWKQNDTLKLKCGKDKVCLKINDADYQVVFKIPDFKQFESFQLYCQIPSKCIVRMIDFVISNK